MKLLETYQKIVGRKLVFPQIIEDQEMLKKLDRAFFETKNPYVVSLLFRLQVKDKGLKYAEDLINKSLKGKRNLTEDNLGLINCC